MRGGNREGRAFRRGVIERPDSSCYPSFRSEFRKGDVLLTDDKQWSDVPVENWSELLAALHSTEMIPKHPSQGGHHRSHYVFRGMSDSDWDLLTSLERLSGPSQIVETALLRSFRKYASEGTFSRGSDWEVLSVAQHNGLPTRVLDWTVSPLVAAHFATAEREHFSKDGIIWCIDVVALRDHVLPPAIAAVIQQAPAAVFDIGLLQQAFVKFSDFNATHSSSGEACLFFEPPSLDARIANQFGILSVMNGATLSHHRYFQAKCAAHPNLVRRVIIDKSAKTRGAGHARSE